MTNLSRESAAAMVVGQAMKLSNFHRCVPGAAAEVLVSIWSHYDYALDDAVHLLRRVLEDVDDDASVEELQVVNALAALTRPREIGASS